MNPPWTEPDDVTGRWIGDDPIPATEDQISTLIADAEDTILREFPTLPDRVYTADAPTDSDNPIPLFRVKKVVARVVIRHLRNPTGQRTRMEVAGPYTENVTYGGDSPGSLYLTDEDREELGGLLTGAAFTIDQTPKLPTPSGAHAWLEYGGTWAL